ncbi:MAG: LysM peptidoglycan-binding domain-containing protein [Nitrospira sp.]|nr:LysM peptidoglycan-binding domain-containing protein [Nitrospira sp.]
MALRIVLMGATLGGCATASEVPVLHGIHEAERALQLMQEREKELTALRAELAATRIAAAKQEAELHDLRTSVVQLRQENGESHQALVEAKRALDTRDRELTAMKMEHERPVQASVPTSDKEHDLTALHHTVASLSQELGTIKAAMAQISRPPPAAAASSGDLMAAALSSQPALSVRRPASAWNHEKTHGMIPAVHRLGEDDQRPRPSWITVQPGESWWTLARKHHTTIKALRRVNGRVGDALMVGDVLRLP